MLIPVSAVYANNTEINIGDVTAAGVGNACVNLDGADYELTRMAAEPGRYLFLFTI